jgi:hypothetical protein
MSSKLISTNVFCEKLSFSFSFSFFLSDDFSPFPGLVADSKHNAKCQMGKDENKLFVVI